MTYVKNPDHLITLLDKANIPARQQKVPRYRTENVFLLSLSSKRNTLIFEWPKDAPVKDIQVFPAKKLRQAVIQVHESERQITESVYTRWFAGSFASEKQLRDRARRRFQSGHHFPVNLPDEAKFEVKRGSIQISVERGSFPSGVCVGATVTAIVPEGFTSFLVGYDEDHLFISALPVTASDVAEAHAILRPDVSENAVRQGEWFFDPVTEQKLIDKLNRNRSWIDSRLGDHSASLVCDEGGRNGKTYVLGYIWNPRHKTILLPGWHRAVHNLELEADSDSWD